MLLVLLANALFAAAFFLVGEVVTLPARERASSLRRAAGYGRSEGTGQPQRESFRERVVDPLRARLAGIVLRASPRTTLQSVSLKLIAAGVSRTVSPVGFLAAKALLAIAGLLGGGLLGAAAGTAGGALFLAAAFAGIGYLLPEGFLTFRARKRRELVRAKLPDALDLLAVSVEAGLGFDAAIAKLVERTSGPLSEELELTLSEMRIGESRENALKKLADRVDVAEVGGFVRALVQADQLGMSIGKILRVQASETRLRRQAAAEERAMKAPIKMLFPTVLFIFPAMFLVILGPAFLNLLDLF